MTITLEHKTGSATVHDDVEGWSFHFAEGWLEVVTEEHVYFYALEDLSSVIVPKLEADDNER